MVRKPVFRSTARHTTRYLYRGQRMADEQTDQKKYYGKVKSPLIRLIVGNSIGALAVYWVFQGLLYMDPTERWFKLGIDVVLLALIGLPLSFWLPLPLALLIGAIVAHTINFVLNGQIYGVLKHFGYVENTWEDFNDEVKRLERRTLAEPHIRFAAIYGSVSRGEWSPTSDIDIRVVRTPGIYSAWRVCWFAVCERARSFWKKFPLDILVLDGYESLSRLAERNPVILVSRDQDEGSYHLSSQSQPD